MALAVAAYLNLATGDERLTARAGSLVGDAVGMPHRERGEGKTGRLSVVAFDGHGERSDVDQ